MPGLPFHGVLSWVIFSGQEKAPAPWEQRQRASPSAGRAIIKHVHAERAAGGVRRYPDGHRRQPQRRVPKRGAPRLVRACSAGVGVPMLCMKYLISYSGVSTLVHFRILGGRAVPTAPRQWWVFPPQMSMPIATSPLRSASLSYGTAVISAPLYSQSHVKPSPFL